ncbi:hypothetical protein HWV62_19299 [Athelia sp. TMB]|nr:hypothetical protein HWV62_19299 [Athelia sp. TMB]
MIPLLRSDQLSGRKGGVKAFGAFGRPRQAQRAIPNTYTFSAPPPTLLSNAGIVKRKQEAKANYTLQRNALSRDELSRLAELAARSAADSTAEQQDFDMGDYSDVASGRDSIQISHAGGEMAAMAAAVIPSKERRVDRRKRRHRNQLRQQGFDVQLEALTDSYGTFIYHRDNGTTQDTMLGGENAMASYQIRAQDTYTTDELKITYSTGAMSPCAAIVAQGVIPTAPQTPTLGFRVETLELYRTAHFRCPQLSVQAWTRTMADLQGLSAQEVYARYRSRQFSIAYDLYLAIRANMQSRVDRALGREDPNWNLKHVCPPCMYKLQDEPEMRFSMLWAEDGNDSLKRFERREASEEGPSGPILGSLRESADTRTSLPGNMYLSRGEVDKWAAVPGARNHDPEEDNSDTCRERWKNMKPEATARSWGCFGETGIFASFCRHRMNLTIADMYRSGEQSKYGLATAARMLDHHGANQGAGLDIGCSHKKTLANSALGPRAHELNHTVLVDAFHGHAHNRLCQLNNLTTYVDGLGLEALGVCEQAFSKSNALAGSTRSMATYIETMYKKALHILDKYPAALEVSKAALGITGASPFKGWLAEEKQYLQGLKSEPPQETLAMEYYQRLTHLWHCDTLLQAVRSVGFHPTDPMARDHTSAIEARRRHAIENHQIANAHVQNLELRLGIQARWTAQSMEYVETGRMVAMRGYQRALDTVEGLVVARIFELGSMNRAGMGYKRRQHMGEALTTRSTAIKNAVERYNIAALALDPPREHILL